MTLRLLTYNVCRGGRGREAALAQVIRACAADLVILQESTVPAVVERIADGAGMAQWGARPRASLGFLAREPVQRASWRRPRVSRHAFVEVLPAGCDVPVFGVHLSAVHAAWTERRRTFEVRALMSSIRTGGHGFHILAGDFNTLAPGELLNVRKLPRRLRALVWLSGGRVRWRTIQMVFDAGYADAFRRLHPHDTGLTFPTWDPHVRLDYLFVPQDAAARVRSCEVVRTPETRTASDHFPLLSVIDV